jgi:hypothetical protein
VHIWDQYQQQFFTLHAFIFVCIHDAPRGFTLSRKTKGKSGTCSICVDGTASLYLPSSRKLVYMRHRRFLPRKHKYRKMKSHFDNTIKKDSAPKKYTGKLVFEMVKNIEVVFGKGTVKGQNRKKTPTPTDIPFKKQSIIFKYLPYWKDLQTCHSIDLMHVTKNVFDSIIGTLLDMPRKTKDGLKSCTDLVHFELRPELHLILRPNEKHFLPSASYTLTVEEKKAFCQCLHGVQVSTGFSSNIRKLVSINDLLMFGYNSNNCHVMMMVFLAITIRAIKPVHMKVLITRLCYFVNTVSQKVIGHKEFDDLRAYMIETMCMLEMYFPPSFFDMQQHIMIQLVDQILTLGPLYLQSMFSFEWYLAVLKSYVQNRAHSEGSIVEGYTTEEVSVAQIT